MITHVCSLRRVDVTHESEDESLRVVRDRCPRRGSLHRDIEKSPHIIERVQAITSRHGVRDHDVQLDIPIVSHRDQPQQVALDHRGLGPKAHHRSQHPLVTCTRPSHIIVLWVDVSSRDTAKHLAQRIGVDIGVSLLRVRQLVLDPHQGRALHPRLLTVRLRLPIRPAKNPPHHHGDNDDERARFGEFHQLPFLPDEPRDDSQRPRPSRTRRNNNKEKHRADFGRPIPHRVAYGLGLDLHQHHGGHQDERGDACPRWHPCVSPLPRGEKQDGGRGKEQGESHNIEVGPLSEVPRHQGGIRGEEGERGHHRHTHRLQRRHRVGRSCRNGRRDRHVERHARSTSRSAPHRRSTPDALHALADDAAHPKARRGSTQATAVVVNANAPPRLLRLLNYPPLHRHRGGVRMPMRVDQRLSNSARESSERSLIDFSPSHVSTQVTDKVHLHVRGFQVDDGTGQVNTKVPGP